MVPYLLKVSTKRKITKIVTDHTYTQFRFTKIQVLITSNTEAVCAGKRLETKVTDIIKIKLGATIPGLKVEFLMFFEKYSWLVLRYNTKQAFYCFLGGFIEWSFTRIKSCTSYFPDH